MRRVSFLGLALVVVCAVASAAHEPSESTGGTDSEGCDPEAEPVFTEEQLEQLCDMEQEPSRPPDPDGHCHVEVRLTGTRFVTGQGVSEGRGEISFGATAESVDGDTEVHEASGGVTTYNKGEKKDHEKDLGSYVVPLGSTQDVKVCVEFVEHDYGGLNGGDDVASDCREITLRCLAADLNGDGLPDGQPSFPATIGPMDFCGDSVCLGSASARIEVMTADADMDCVPNDKDFTPELCDEVGKGRRGLGALVYYHYDDEGLTNTFQSAFINIAQVYDHYDYEVLVADNRSSNSMNLMAPAFKGADKVFPPTREGILDAMQDLTSQGYRFDTFVFAHGYKAGEDDASFEVLTGDRISGQWLVEATEPSEIGTDRGGIPIMAWWSTTCIAARQIDTWVEIGALAASGAIDVEFRPNAWDHFFDDWVNGKRYKRAVDDSHTPFVIFSSEFALREMGKKAPWLCRNEDPETEEEGDGPGVVTDLNACAEDFFNDDVLPNEAKYNIQQVYDHSVSGARNMAIASERMFEGAKNLTFGAVGRDWP